MYKLEILDITNPDPNHKTDNNGSRSFFEIYYQYYYVTAVSIIFYVYYHYCTIPPGRTLKEDPEKAYT